ncbi:MAG: hypothetical protein HFI26_03190 [Lachnospiraceae bacterium]|jgi:energy-coupling factor transporter ATP-binding protein EcfA2|nr:hypothetical protein [Lachnospiraceae bacterium]
MNSEIAKSRIGEVIRIDTVASTQADFLATHVPVNHIHIKKKWDSKSDKVMSEEQVFNKYILNTENKHQFIIVIGSSGAGKSHLIRWFAARLEQSIPENEVVLFVRRSDNSLKGTIKQLLELPEVASIPNKAVYDRLVRATSTIDNKKLKDMIYQNFIVEIKNDEDDEILSNNEKKRLVEFLQYEQFQMKLMREEGAIDRIYQKVAENETGDSRDAMALFETEDFIVDVNFCDDMITNGAAKNARKMADTILAEDEMPERLSDYMNTLVNKVVQTCAGLEPGDFEQVFVEIRKEIKRQGKNLTLLIEDITAFTGVNVALLNVLTTEHTGMYESQELCRISSIVGTTEKYFNINFMDNHKDRVTQFFCIPNDVFGEKQDSLYEFVGRYLNVMSLKSNILEDWARNGAALKDYPIHKGEEKANWDVVVIGKGKELSLFPFTKKAISNLYMCILQPDYRTPRYLLRDVIERAVRNYLFKKDSFPEFSIERINDIPFESLYVSTYIHQHVEEGSADRVERFVRVWGDASDLEYEENGIRYVGGMPVAFYEDLHIPCFEGRKSGKKSVAPLSIKTKGEKSDKKIEDSDKTNIQSSKADPAMADFLLGQRTLQIWIDGGELNVGATTKDVINITKARDEINKRFLISAINWQVEGVSLDNLNRVKGTKDFIGFERQKRSLKNALLILPADRETQGILEAFLAYVTLGNGSWNFDNSSMMVYRVQLWVEKWKKSIVEAVNLFEGRKTDYQDCAIAAEMVREIMQGVFTGTKVEGIPATNLMAKNLKKISQNAHCPEWNSMISMLLNYDEKIKDVITQYYNIVQGNLRSSQVFIRATEFNLDVRRIQKSRLIIPDVQLMLNDPIPQRREIREIFEKIQIRLPKVAEAEKEKAKSMLAQLAAFMDYEGVDDEDIEDLVVKIKDFYETAGTSLVNIHGNIELIDKVRKEAKTISVAISEIIRGIKCEDYIDVLMMFSKDPLAKVERLLALFVSVQKDIDYVTKDVAKRKETIRIAHDGDIGAKYDNSKKSIMESKRLVADWKVKGC